MKINLGFLRTVLQKYGVGEPKAFFILMGLISFGSAMAMFTGTYINLDVHDLAEFKGVRASWDFMMPCLGTFLGTLFFPKIQTYFSIKSQCLISCLGIILFYGIMIFLIDTIFNYPLRFCIGFFYGVMFLSVRYKLTLLYNPPYRGRLFGITAAILALFSALGAAFVDFFEKPAQVFSVGIIGLCFCMWFCLKLDAEKKNPSTRVEAGKNTKTQKRDHSSSIYYILALSPFIFMSIFMIGNLKGANAAYLPIYCENLGITEGRAALMFSFASLGILPVMPFVGWLGDKWGYEKSLLLMAVIGFFISILIFFLKDILFISLAFFLMKGSQAAFITLIYGWVPAVYGTRHLSYALSSFSVIKAISYIIAPLGVGILMRSFGNEGFLYWILGCSLLAFVFMVLQLRGTSSK